MLMPMELLPPASPALEPEPPPGALEGVLEPPPVPEPLPSGEMATREARFPLGTSTTGAGGAGEDERAISVAAGPPDWPVAAAATSGAAATSPFCLRSANRGAEPALMLSCGFAGASASWARLISAERVSRFGTSGAGVSVVATFFTCFGRSLAKVFSLISKRGRSGAEGVAS